MRLYNSIATVATLTAIYGFILDVMLSLCAYHQNPNYFLQFEANKELVSFLSTGTMPLFLYVTPTLIIFLHFLNRLFVSKYKESSKLSTIYQLFIINMIFMGITRTSGGLTWYIYIFRFIIQPMQALGLLLLLAYCAAIILASVEKEKKVKALKLPS